MRNAFGDASLSSISSVDELQRAHDGREGTLEKEVWNLSSDSSTEADVIERLVILATTIAVDSQQQSMLFGFHPFFGPSSKLSKPMT